MSSPSSHFTMLRHSSQRSYRANLAKGLKVKHVLQIVIVIVVLTWVSYELNLSQKPASSQDTEQEASLGRKALKPEGGLGKVHVEVETDITTDPDGTATNSSHEENFDGFRTEEDSDDQRDRDISELDIEHATDQDEKSEDEVQPDDIADVRHDVGTDFEELKNEEARVEQEKFGENGQDGNDGDVDQGSDSQSQNNEAATSDDVSTEGGSHDDNHLESVVDEDKKAEEASGVTFMDALNVDSVLKPKLDKLDEGETDDTSRANLDETEDSGQEVVEKRSADQNDDEEEEEGADQNEEKSAGQTVDPSEASTKSDTTEDNVNSQSQVDVALVDLDTQSEEQSNINREKTEVSVESHEEGKVDERVETEEQRQKSGRYEAVKEETQSQELVGGEEKPKENIDTQSHVQEQEEKSQEEGFEKRADDTQTQQRTEVKSAESNIQPELKSEGADVEVENKKYVQPDEEEDDDQAGSDGNQDRLAGEKSIQDFQGTSAEKKEESQQDHESGEKQNDSESQQDNTKLTKDESVETNSVNQETQVGTDDNGAEHSSDASDGKMEKSSQEDDSAGAVNMDASTQEKPKQEDESSKDETLKQVIDSNAAGSGESNAKVEESNKADQDVTNTQ